jgi:hypothetical protein
MQSGGRSDLVSMKYAKFNRLCRIDPKGSVEAGSADGTSGVGNRSAD